jgi:hypothetical protein
MFQSQIGELVGSSPAYIQIIQYFKQAAQLGNNTDPCEGFFTLDHFGEFLRIYSDRQNLLTWLKSLKSIIRNLYDSELTIIPGSMKKVNH